MGAPPEPNHLEVEKFVTDTLILIMPPNHPLAAKERASIQDVIKQPFIAREVGSGGTRKTIENALQKQNIAPAQINEIMDLGSSQAVLAGVEAGLGVSIISQYAAEKALALGTVTTIPFKDIEFRRDLYLAFDKSRFLTRTQKEFIRFALRKQELQFS